MLYINNYIYKMELTKCIQHRTRLCHTYRTTIKTKYHNVKSRISLLCFSLSSKSCIKTHSIYIIKYTATIFIKLILKMINIYTMKWSRKFIIHVSILLLLTDKEHILCDDKVPWLLTADPGWQGCTWLAICY